MGDIPVAAPPRAIYTATEKMGAQCPGPTGITNIGVLLFWVIGEGLLFFLCVMMFDYENQNRRPPQLLLF